MRRVRRCCQPGDFANPVGSRFLATGYCPAERKLYPKEASADQQELFLEALLKVGPSVPMLEPYDGAGATSPPQ